MPLPLPLPPLPDGAIPQPRKELFATLARIDGWGQGAWQEISGLWRLSTGLLAVDDLEAEVSRDADDRVVSLTLILQEYGLGGTPEDADATCDWVLRELWREVMPAVAVTATTHIPGSSVRACNACTLEPLHPGAAPALILRLLVRLPLAGMCCDGRRMARALRQLEAFLRSLAQRRRRPGLAAHRRCVGRQRLLRSALSSHGLVAFIGAGARLARDRDDRPAPGCRPLRVARAQAATIDLGTWGRVRGLGIRHGVTALAGAPYHGKSTLLQAIIAGRNDHPPGDGRELVVSDASVLPIQAEDGRRIKSLDITPFFSRLPGAQPKDFSTARASGATSMAASLLQGVAAGCRLLAIDEDSAASNFLAIDPTMRALLGAAAHGTTALMDVLPALSAAGVSTVLVAGANSTSLMACDRVLLMENYQPRDVTARVRRLLGRSRRRASRPCRPCAMPLRILEDDPDCLFGPRHFLMVDAREPGRPVVAGQTLDLRRCGWELDTALVRGALAAAAWTCRLAGSAPRTMPELARLYQQFITERGVRGLDPFSTALLSAPPWQLVVAVLERLLRPSIRSALAPHTTTSASFPSRRRPGP